MVEQLRQKIEWSALQLIKRLTAIGKMSQKQAQTMAAHILECVKPGMTPEDFFKGVFRLDDGYPELAHLVTPLAQMYKEKVENPTTEYIRGLIKSSKYTEAVGIAKKLVDQDIKLKFVAKGRSSAQS